MHFQLEIQTTENFQVIDITKDVQQKLAGLQADQGQLLISVQHTTTALTINENESRLLQDMQNYFAKLAPKGDRYLHNDLHLRDVPPDEPENAHAHLIAMMLNTNETLGVQAQSLILGQYQSLLFLELDGPRQRKIYGQFTGTFRTEASQSV